MTIEQSNERARELLLNIIRDFNVRYYNCEYVFSFTKDVQVDIHMVVDVNAETIQTLDYMRDIMLEMRPTYGVLDNYTLSSPSELTVFDVDYMSDFNWEDEPLCGVVELCDREEEENKIDIAYKNTFEYKVHLLHLAINEYLTALAEFFKIDKLLDWLVKKN